MEYFTAVTFKWSKFLIFFSLRLNSQKHKDMFCSFNVSGPDPVPYLAKTGMCRWKYVFQEQGKHFQVQKRDRLS